MEITGVVAVVDTHTGGEPTRLIIGGAPLLKGETMGEKWLDLRENHDDFRVLTMCEPRGHGDMFGALLTPPCRKEAHFGVIFMDSGGSLSMCGHGSIGLARTAVKLGWIAKAEPYTEVVFDTVAGLVHMKVEVSGGQVGEVELGNVPAFVYERDVEVFVPSLGRKIGLDISFGGNFFAIVPAGQLDLTLSADEVPFLTRLGLEIRRIVNEAVAVRHPLEPAIDRVELTEFSLERSGLPTRNIVVFGQGSVDRSPCGTGTCAKMALLAAEGRLAPGETFLHEGVTGSLFTGSVSVGPKVGGFETVLPLVRGRSWVTGFNFLVRQPQDDVGPGFLLKR